MSQEGQLLDKKSLRAVSGKTADWAELAKDCVAFANSTGGHLLIGIEDDQDQPPRSLEQLVKEGALHQEGVRNGTHYRLP